MVVLEIKTLGAENFVRGFNRFAEQVEDWRPVFNDIRADFLQGEAENFRREGTPERWVALSPAYAAWKAVHFPGKPILERTGRMKRSISTLTGDVDTVNKMEKLRAEFGTVVPYAHYHQEGAPNLPQRKVVQLTDRRKVAWSRMIHEWAYREASRA